MSRIFNDIEAMKEDVKYMKRKLAQLNTEAKRMDNNINRHEEILSLKLSVSKFTPKNDFEEKPVS